MVLRSVIVPVFFALSSAVACPARPQTEARCLSYESTVVKLTGTLTRETFPGPPNYESVRKGDKPEIYWILNVARPICVDAIHTDSGSSPAKEDIRRVQLVFTDSLAYKKYKEFLSKEVVATGTLFAAETGHHHTAVLLTVENLARAK
jgi:hypothetical protein